MHYIQNIQTSLFSKIILWIARIFVLGIPALLFPILLFYAMSLSAEPITDPLEGYEEVKAIDNEMVSIPVPIKSIRKGQMITHTNLKLISMHQELVSKMVAQDILEVVGQEAKQTLYKNKPILIKDIGSMTIIHRNDQVPLLFKKEALELQTVGRALEEGGAGDIIRVINIQSKKVISGIITRNGEVDVSI